MISTQFSQVETNPWKILLGDFGLSQIIEGTNTIGTKTRPWHKLLSIFWEIWVYLSNQEILETLLGNLGNT